MSAIQPNRQIVEYGLGADRSKKATAAGAVISGGAAAILSLGANALITPNDWKGGLVTMGSTIFASSTGALMGRLIDKVEESDNPSLKKVARTSAGIVGGAGLALSLTNTINIIYTGDLLSVQHQLGFCLVGSIAGGIFGKFTDRWGSALGNIGTSTSLTTVMTTAASYLLPNYLQLTPIPMALSFSSLLCHPFKAELS
ncbi:MAG: hypothetical protein LLF94_04450 [Chlamydiales bacterium]|nr:hypothetical protein [Chlamydiales bacterium]